MCGILAFLAKKNISSIDAHFETALKTIAHRGPDESGIWMDAEAGIYLGHRRLSILDLSPAGKQPMFSANGRWVISYNGEIYNYQTIRQELISSGRTFRTGTDTEVLLEGIDQWGIETTLQKTVGMFSFVVWDRKEKVLFIARDRFGEKPCYVAETPQGWIIASELKTITAFPFFEKKIDRQSIQLFLQKKYIPEPKTIYTNVSKLKPGYYAVIQPDLTLHEIPYWSFLDCAARGQENPLSISEDEAAAQMESLLKDTIRLQKFADVPVGAFLSGGIDSSLIVAIMQSTEGKPVKTFSIGFCEADFDESSYARAVAAHLKTDHSELIVTPKEAQDVIPQLCSIYDEPYADSSAIPTILVSRLAKQQVTVSLSGDAGDEIFGGYTRYRYMAEVWSKVNKIPYFARVAAGIPLKMAKQAAWRMKNHHLAYRLMMRQRYASVKSYPDLYDCHMTNFRMSDEYLMNPHSLPFPGIVPDSLPFYHYAMATDTLDYLPGDILTKVDRAAMSISLETRIPLLDHRIVEWADVPDVAGTTKNQWRYWEKNHA